MRRLMIRSALTLFVLGGAVAIASPAGAGEAVADIKIAKQKSGPYKTNNLYEDDGPFGDHEQRITKVVKPGKAKNSFVKIQNDDPNTGIVNFQPFAGCADHGAVIGLCVRWFEPDGTEITNEIEASGYPMQLDGGETQRLRVKTKVRKTHNIANDAAEIHIVAEAEAGSDDAAILQVKVG